MTNINYYYFLLELDFNHFKVKYIYRELFFPLNLNTQKRHKKFKLKNNFQRILFNFPPGEELK